MLDALAQGAGPYKGIAVVRNDAGLAELQDLQASGVVGVAFNAALLGGAMRTAISARYSNACAIWTCGRSSRSATTSSWRCGRPDIQASLGQAGFAALLVLFEQLLPDADARHAVMWETPRRLFGFEG